MARRKIRSRTSAFGRAPVSAAGVPRRRKVAGGRVPYLRHSPPLRGDHARPLTFDFWISLTARQTAGEVRPENEGETDGSCVPPLSADLDTGGPRRRRARPAQRRGARLPGDPGAARLRRDRASAGALPQALLRGLLAHRPPRRHDPRAPRRRREARRPGDLRRGPAARRTATARARAATPPAHHRGYLEAEVLSLGLPPRMRAA